VTLKKLGRVRRGTFSTESVKSVVIGLARSSINVRSTLKADAQAARRQMTRRAISGSGTRHRYISFWCGTNSKKVANLAGQVFGLCVFRALEDDAPRVS
jgi:hypothetical protein